MICFGFFVFYVSLIQSQQPVKEFFPKDFTEQKFEAYGKKKRIPESIRPQVLTALSYYPELKNTRITFRFRKRTTPLASRPRFFSAFLPKGIRSYVITISTESNSKLSPILFKNLPYNAQIGVIGHEIAHTVYYKKRTSFQLIGIASKLGNTKFVDNFEYETDKRTIQHGLGYQLLAWSEFVRSALQIKEWTGFNEDEKSFDNSNGERYMNPKSIKDYIKTFPSYNNIE